MKGKIAGAVVRLRFVILVLAAVAVYFSCASIGRTRINYDLTRYLDENTMTRRSLKVMEEEFGASEQLRVMFLDLDEDTLRERLYALNDLPQVHIAAHDARTDVKTLDGVTYQLITLTLRDCDASRLVEELRALYPGEYYVGGSTAQLKDIQDSVAKEIPLVMMISVAVVLAVLLLTSHAWLEPVVILLVLAVSIVINMGTNFIFPDVSFITFAVSAILQLALSIDYAIMLLHAYNAFLDAGDSREQAMREALSQSFMPVASSAFTTAAGLLSLLFMSFTIGFDIGMVLSKGILISMLTVFLLMPALTLLFGPLLKATRHKPLRLHGEKLGALVHRVRKPLAVLLTLLVAAGAVLQQGNTYLFTDSGRSTQFGQDQKINDVFGASAPLALLVPGGDGDEDYARQPVLAERLLALRLDDQPLVRQLDAMVTTGGDALRYYTVQDVAQMTGLSQPVVSLFFITQGFGSQARADKLLEKAGALARDNEQITALQTALQTAREAFCGPRYARMILTLSFADRDERIRESIDLIRAAAQEIYGQDYYLTGIPMSTHDIGSAFQGDLMKVNLITLLAILLIVALSFRAVRLPLLMVFVIEGAIWVTMGISRVMGEPIFFMSYLICVSIQMGATIDYGILLSSHYRRAREMDLEPRDALCYAMKKALPTVLTSGVILTTAGYIVGKKCTVYYISAIGALLARGALVSALLMLTLLPALLAVFDRWAAKKEKREA